MSTRRPVLFAVLALLTLPVMVAAVEAVSFYVLNRNNGSIVSAGSKREYLLHVPDSYDAGKATPLVISMHAAALWPAAQSAISQWNAEADRSGFIVVHPAAQSSGPMVWRVDGSAGLEKDVAFIRELMDTLRARYNIDERRIYASGLSNGGGMAFVLSCALADRIAAVGLVASAQTLPWIWCQSRQPVPVIAFHGTADPVVPYDGRRSWIAAKPFPNMEAWASNWSRRNRCAQQPAITRVATDVKLIAYTGCANGAEVALYSIEGGGHSWPGSKPLAEWAMRPTNQSINATRLQWDFFRRFTVFDAGQGATYIRR